MALSGHERDVTSVAFAPDGKTLASGSLDGTLRLWDLATGKEAATCRWDKAVITSVAFAPDGKTVAVGGGGKGDVKLWDTSSGKDVRTMGGHSKAVFGIAFSPDGKHLTSGSQDCTVKVWDVSTGKEVFNLEGHRGLGVCGVAFSPDGKVLASAGIDGTVRLWDTTTGKAMATYQGKKAVFCVAFSPDGKTVAAGTDVDGLVEITSMGQVVLWDTQTGKVKTSLAVHYGYPTGAAWPAPAATIVWSPSTEAPGTTLASMPGNNLSLEGSGRAPTSWTASTRNSGLTVPPRPGL
jgi:WD40 repeat protein